MRHQRQSLVVEKAVGLDVLGAEIVGIIEMLDAGGGLETACAHESAIGGIERQGTVSATPQREWQSALDAPGGDARDEVREPSKGSRRQPRQHIVFGEPARPAIALGQKLALLAVERFEMAAVGGWKLDALRLANVKTGLIVDHDDERPAPGRLVGVQQRDVQPPAPRRIRFHEAEMDEVRDGGDAGAREFREITVMEVAGAPSC